MERDANTVHNEILESKGAIYRFLQTEAGEGELLENIGKLPEPGTSLPIIQPLPESYQQTDDNGLEFTGPYAELVDYIAGGIAPLWMSSMPMDKLRQLMRQLWDLQTQGPNASYPLRLALVDITDKYHQVFYSRGEAGAPLLPGSIITRITDIKPVS